MFTPENRLSYVIKEERRKEAIFEQEKEQRRIQKINHIIAKEHQSRKNKILVNHIVENFEKYFTLNHSQNCKYNKGHNLNAHHIKELSILIYENKINSLEEAYSCPIFWDINNGITLCKDCHKIVHKKQST